MMCLGVGIHNKLITPQKLTVGNLLVVTGNAYIFIQKVLFCHLKKGDTNMVYL